MGITQDKMKEELDEIKSLTAGLFKRARKIGSVPEEGKDPAVAFIVGWEKIRKSLEPLSPVHAKFRKHVPGGADVMLDVWDRKEVGLIDKLKNDPRAIECHESAIGPNAARVQSKLM